MNIFICLQANIYWYPILAELHSKRNVFKNNYIFNDKSKYFSTFKHSIFPIKIWAICTLKSKVIWFHWRTYCMYLQKNGGKGGIELVVPNKWGWNLGVSALYLPYFPPMVKILIGTPLAWYVGLSFAFVYVSSTYGIYLY